MKSPAATRAVATTPAEDARDMTEKLAKMVRGYARDRSRVRNLILFEPREKEGAWKNMSDVWWDDRPQVELLLYHRTQCLKLERLIKDAEGVIRAQWEDPGEVCRGLEAIDRLEAKRMKHLHSLETILATVTKTLGDQEAIMARLAADAAHLSQKAMEHQDKMELARKTASIPTTAQLKERLAAKYNIPVEDVEKVLAAKAIDVDAD